MNKTTLLLSVSSIIGVALTSTLRCADNSVEGDSPDESIHWQVRAGTKNDEVWLSPKDNKEAAVLLCEIANRYNVKLHFSPDHQWLIVQDGGPSAGVYLTLFKRGAGVQFKPIEKPDINDAAEEVAMKQSGLDQKTHLGHRYVKCLGWSPDSTATLIHLDGYDQIDHIAYGGEWFGIYNIASRSFTFDLLKFNKPGITKEKLE